MEEDSWPRIAWNYKPLGRRERRIQEDAGEKILRPVQALA
jgi:hypothetical protein